MQTRKLLMNASMIVGLGLCVLAVVFLIFSIIQMVDLKAVEALVTGVVGCFLLSAVGLGLLLLRELLAVQCRANQMISKLPQDIALQQKIAE